MVKRLFGFLDVRAWYVFHIALLVVVLSLSYFVFDWLFNSSNVFWMTVWFFFVVWFYDSAFHKFSGKD